MTFQNVRLLISRTFQDQTHFPMYLAQNARVTGGHWCECLLTTSCGRGHRICGQRQTWTPKCLHPHISGWDPSKRFYDIFSIDTVVANINNFVKYLTSKKLAVNW